MTGGRLERGRSSSASMPPASYRARHEITICRVNLVCGCGIGPRVVIVGRGGNLVRETVFAPGVACLLCAGMQTVIGAG
jgi:hypothetical protein